MRFFFFFFLPSLLDPLLTALVGTKSYSATRIAAPYTITNMGYVLGHRSIDRDSDVELGENSTTPITPLFFFFFFFFLLFLTDIAELPASRTEEEITRAQTF